MHNADPVPNGLYDDLYQALAAGYKYNKLLLYAGDLMHEFKLHWPFKNFATYCNLKQL